MMQVALPTRRPFRLLAVAVIAATLSAAGIAALVGSPSQVEAVAAVQENACSITITATPSLNLRSGPSTRNPVVARAQPGQRWQVYEVAFEDITATRVNEWARLQLEDGRSVWAAVYHNGSVYARFDLTQICSDVRFPTTRTPEPTGTPLPSVTPSPVRTAGGPSATPIVPTQEQGGVTAVPTSPAQITCTVVMNRGVLVRSGPGTNNRIVSSVATGRTIQIRRVELGSSFLWAEHAGGWSAIYDRATSTWWVNPRGAESDTCPDVPGWPAELGTLRASVVDGLTRMARVGYAALIGREAGPLVG